MSEDKNPLLDLPYGTGAVRLRGELVVQLDNHMAYVRRVLRALAEKTPIHHSDVVALAANPADVTATYGSLAIMEAFEAAAAERAPKP